MQTMLNNFINGNLTDAKKQASKYGLFDIARTLRDVYGYSRDKAIMTASYLKGRCTYQAACDAS